MKPSFAADFNVKVVMCKFSRRSAVGCSAWLGRLGHLTVPPFPILNSQFIVGIHRQRSAVELTGRFPTSSGTKCISLAAHRRTQIRSKLRSGSEMLKRDFKVLEFKVTAPRKIRLQGSNGCSAISRSREGIAPAQSCRAMYVFASSCQGCDSCDVIDLTCEYADNFDGYPAYWPTNPAFFADLRKARDRNKPDFSQLRGWAR
jgi:hypothetical protein